MFKVPAEPLRRFAVLTVFCGTTAINDETTAEPLRSWRWHCGLCRTSTAVVPRLRCDGGISCGASLLGLNWIQAFQLDINTLLYTPKASSELPSPDVHTVGGPTDLDLKIYLVRVHSLSMSGSQDLALLARCCSISVSRSSKPAAFPGFSSMRPFASSSRLKGLLLGTIVLFCVPLFFQ